MYRLNSADGDDVRQSALVGRLMDPTRRQFLQRSVRRYTASDGLTSVRQGKPTHRTMIGPTRTLCQLLLCRTARSVNAPLGLGLGLGLYGSDASVRVIRRSDAVLRRTLRRLFVSLQSPQNTLSGFINFLFVGLCFTQVIVGSETETAFNTVLTLTIRPSIHHVFSI